MEKTINDLEKEKFYSEGGNIVIKSESVAYGGEVGSDFSIEDLEKGKFNENGEIRTVITF